MIESKGYKITPIDGDLAVSRNAEVGGDVDIHGKARVAGSLKVEGFLDAPNIKGVVKGLFATEEELKREYPNPGPGWCAIVLADDERGFLYLVKNREWKKQSEEAKPFDFIVDSINVFASKGELADETQRAQSAENKLQSNIETEVGARTGAVNEIKGKAALFGTFASRAEADGLLVKYENINHYEGAFSIPVATEEKAGVMSAVDKSNLDTINTELFPRTVTPNFKGSDSVASGVFNKWWGFSTSEDSVSGLLVAIDFGSSPTNNKIWQYRLGKKVRDGSGVITGLTTVQGSEGTIVIQAGETRAYLPNAIRFEKDYVLELYFATIQSDENLLYKSNATNSYYIRFVDGVSVSGSMYQINAVVIPAISTLTELQDEVHKLSSEHIIKSKNLFDRSKVVPGFVDSIWGDVVTNDVDYPKAITSPIIDVEPNTYYSISGRTDTKGIVGYDFQGNKVQIIEGSWALPDYNGTFLIPSNVVKIQFSCVLRHEFSKTDLIQLEKGESITSYSEYHTPQPINEVVTNLKSEQPSIIAGLSDASIRATSVYDLVKTLNRNSEILTPNYKNAGTSVAGDFNNWWGYSTVNDLSTDCFLSGITFSGSLNNNYTFKARISKKVRDNEGIITGLQTVSDIFELTLKAGESRVDTPFLHFAADNVLEIEYNTVRSGLIKYRSGAADGVTFIKFQDQVVTPGSMWDVNINLIPSRSTEQHSTKALKVLSIGNSFSQDAFGYVPYIFNKCCSDVNLTFGILYYGGASLENHYNFLVGENKEYTYHKSDKWGAWVNTPAYSIQDALADEDWDVIVLQQNGKNAGDYSSFQPYLNNIIDMLFNMLNKPVRFAWHITEAYSNDLETSVEQFTSYCNATKEVLDKTVIDLVFPSATGLQNARTTVLQTLGDAGNLMHTSNHTQEGIPCYCLALPNVIVLLELCGYKYKGVFGEDTVPTQSWITSINMPGPNGVSVGATIENCKIAQKCAIMAIKNPYAITDCSEI